ncbi:MAG: hypothetical protein GXX85_16560 [Ignavibacteria bacterium]|nr:hypothetical protein [Ignavibacteria bacterium]
MKINEEFLFNDLISNKVLFFNFMKEKYPFYKDSNIFFRDLQFAIKSFFEKKEIIISSITSQKLAENLIFSLENKQEIKRISNNAWNVLFSLNYGVNITTPDNNKNE